MLGVLTLGAVAEAQEARDDLDATAALLSHYKPGFVPLGPVTMGAIYSLGDEGTRAEVSLLRSLVETERAEVCQAAMVSIERIRQRQREHQRSLFAHTLRGALHRETLAIAGSESSNVLAYADAVLGTDPSWMPRATTGDAATLLARGEPRKAVAASLGDDDPDRMLQARAREDAGDLRGALRVYADEYSLGSADARAHLEAFGVDPERLLLGLMLHAKDPSDEGHDAVLLETLVRTGSDRTVRVLAEHLHHKAPSERATAVDALARMLEPQLRTQPLSPRSADSARAALRVVVKYEREGVVRDMAVQALHDVR